MSKLESSSSRPSFASRTAFEYLAVDSGEESEEEVSPEVVSPAESSQTTEKSSKSAIKRANRAARLEKKQQQRAAAKALRTQEKHSSASQLSLQEVEEPPSPGSASNPLDTEKAPEPLTLESDIPTHPLPTDDEQAHDAKPNGYVISESSLSPPIAVPPSSEQQILEVLRDAETSPIPLPAKPVFNEYQDNPPSATESVSSHAATEQVKKRQSFLTRTLWTFIMIGGFLGLLLLGHAYMILLVMLCQTLVYREVTALFMLTSKSEPSDPEVRTVKDPWSKTLNWYFFAVTNYFLYGESIIYYFKHVVFADAQLLPFATNHRIISFTLYTIGFMGFVMSLKKGYLKQQFGLFCWVHMSLLLIVVSSHFIINNILEGLIWFWVPASLVICNDVFAYVWGITIGRTPLIALSPKKTVEGFVGAFGSTLIFGVLWGTYFMKFDYMICPVRNFGVSAWSTVECVPNPVFVWKEWGIWAPLSAVISTLFGRSVTTIPYAPYQAHLLFMACFASLVAPFGGFFASGFKRAFNIKDFGHSIPGHGGMTDRMDCQFLMGVYTYVYYSSLIRQHHVTVGSLLQAIVSGLTVQEQLELFRDLRQYLEGQGIVAT